jgi:gamma-glutamyl phosphate reductase
MKIRTKAIRRLTVAVILSLSSAVPVFADDASDLVAAKALIANAKISPQADLLTWCGAAFTLLAQAEKDDADKVKLAQDHAMALFAKAEPLLTADGVKDMTAMGAAYTTVAAAELLTDTGTDKPSHTQDECVAAVGAL